MDGGKCCIPMCSFPLQPVHNFIATCKCNPHVGSLSDLSQRLRPAFGVFVSPCCATREVGGGGTEKVIFQSIFPKFSKCGEREVAKWVKMLES